ncbi:MAG: hypothetical protein ACRYGP_10045 [Janthinobacterium lividum]
MQSEIYEAFRSIDISEDKALKAATALGKRDDEIAAGFAKRDGEIAAIKSDLSVLKWMSGFTLALVVTMFGKMFVH